MVLMHSTRGRVGMTAAGASAAAGFWNVFARSVGMDGGIATAPPYAVGRHLSVGGSTQVMQPVYLPALVQYVVARPGAAGVASQEAWAAGISTAPSTQPGWATGPNGGRLQTQSGLLHHDRGGWTVDGAPVRSDGVTALDVNITSLSIAAAGACSTVADDAHHLTTSEFAVLHHA